MPVSLHYNTNSLQGSCNLWGRWKGIGPLAKVYNLRGFTRRSEHRQAFQYKLFEKKMGKARKPWTKIYGPFQLPNVPRQKRYSRAQTKGPSLYNFIHWFLSVHWLLTVYKRRRLLFSYSNNKDIFISNVRSILNKQMVHIGIHYCIVSVLKTYFKAFPF